MYKDNMKELAIIGAESVYVCVPAASLSIAAGCVAAGITYGTLPIKNNAIKTGMSLAAGFAVESMVYNAATKSLESDIDNFEELYAEAKKAYKKHKEEKQKLLEDLSKEKSEYDEKGENVIHNVFEDENTDEDETDKEV